MTIRFRKFSSFQVFKLSSSLLSLLSLPSLLHAQATTFFVTVANDTMAIETFTRTDSRLEGELKTRGFGPRLKYSLELLNGLPAVMRFSAYSGESDTTVMQTTVGTFKGDSVIVEMTTQGKTIPQRIATQTGAFPFINLAFSLLEPVLQHARAAGVTAVPLFSASGGATYPSTISWIGKDSAVVKVGPVEVRLNIDDQGRILGGASPEQKMRILRSMSTTSVKLSKPDYSAPADAVYTAEAVIIPTPEGHVLGGTLTLPKNRTGRVPVVVTITGTGLQDRDEAVPMLSGYRPFRQIAEALAARGIGVLRYDDRGFGESTGDPAKATSADYANDTRAVLAHLRKRADVDTTKLFLLGHSEGGLIAPLVAATDPHLRGIIVMAGPSRTGKRILEYQNRYSIDLQKDVTQAKRDSLYATALKSLDSLAVAQPWIKWFMSYDPLPAARATRAAVLILHGATDRQATPDQAAELAAAFRAGGNRDVSIHVLPGVNHLFLTDPAGDPATYTSLKDRNVVANAVEIITDWVVQHAKGGQE